jgi:hypothetical protein
MTNNAKTLASNNDLALIKLLKSDLKRHHTNLKTQFLDSIIKTFDNELFNIIKDDLYKFNKYNNSNIIAQAS